MGQLKILYNLFRKDLLVQMILRYLHAKLSYVSIINYHPHQRSYGPPAVMCYFVNIDSMGKI